MKEILDKIQTHLGVVPHTLPSHQNVWERFGPKKECWVVKNSVGYSFGNNRTGEKFFEKEKSSKNVDFSTMVNSLPVATSHSYLERKKIKPHGIKVDDNNNLVIPIFSGDKIAGIQKIFEHKNESGTDKIILGKKKGGYFSFGSFAATSQIYIAEGFATAANIFECSGVATICAFDAGNLLYVGQAIRKKYPDAKIIFCADNDSIKGHTVGEDKARRAAGFVDGWICIPQFITGAHGDLEQGDGTDFNDLFIQSGKEAVLSQLKNVEKVEQSNKNVSGEKIIFLGKNDTYFFIFDNVQKVQKKFIIKSFNRNEAVDIFSLDYLFTYFPNSSGNNFDFLKVLDYVLRESQKAGYWDETRIKKNGIWKIGKNIYFHDGEKLTKNNKPCELGAHDGFLFPKNEFPYLKIVDDEISQYEKKELIELISKLSWKNDYCASIALGWLVVAPLCGILPWRPHLWITGGFGSGKSTVKHLLLERILKIFSVSLLETTPAGVRQMLNEYSVPFLLEEAESDDFDSMQKLKFFVKQVSNSSDASSSRSVKGSAGGTHNEFELRFMAAFCSIHVNLIAPQYRSRFSILELVEDKHNNFSGPGGTEERFDTLIKGNFADRFLKWRLARIDLILENYHIFYLEMKKNFSSRFASQYGMTLSACWTFIHDKKANAEDVMEFVNTMKDLHDVSEETSIKNEASCFETLFSKKIIDGGQSYSIGQIVERIYRPTKFGDDGPKTEFFKKLLEIYGMKFMREQALAVCTSHSELKNLFNGTPYVSGWRQHLLRLPFCFDPKVKSQVWIAGKKFNCIFLDLIKVFESEGDDND